MLTQIELQGGKLPALGRSVQSVSELAGGVAGKVDALSERLSTLDARASGIDAFDEKIESLRSEVAKAATEANELLAPAGELQKHRQAVEQLSSQAVENVAVLDAMKKD
jgi:outer membrane murein-binding lipoprotein Lpp